jgi:SAM-dependent methyltransferase
MIVTGDRRAARQGSASARVRLPGDPSLLVAIASYGTGQDHFLARVIGEYLKLDLRCRIVVLSNVDKAVEGAEVLVGLPSRDSYSLPFAHRKLFRENADRFDLFVYTEDDTLITPANLLAFLEAQQQLPDDEIAGFLRSETDQRGNRYIVSANHHFRWLPESVVTRGRDRFAQFSNQHSGCFIATRSQLSRAIASGGFTLEPRAGRYGMLETAASDIHTQCGLTRVICLTRIEDFIVPHLANKYHGSMGVPMIEFNAQVSALLNRSESGVALFNPETRARGFRWSKHLYRGPDEALLALVPPSTRRILSIGAASGADETALIRKGLDVSAVPLDAVFGEGLAKRGVSIVGTSLAEASGTASQEPFEAVLAADVLHLVPDPLEAMREMARLLTPDGVLVGSVSNTTSLLWPLKDWRRGDRGWIRPAFERNGAHPMNSGKLASLCRASALQLEELVPSVDGMSPRLSRVPMGGVRRMLAPRLLFRARRQA